MDSYGSGPGWGIPYLWPFSQTEWRAPDAWLLLFVENISAALATIAWASSSPGGGGGRRWRR